MRILLDLNVVLDEDNLQVASAVEAKLEAIVTRNPKGFAGSPLPVLTPTEFLAKLPKAP